MTRINCVPVEELHEKHLLAEYKEMPRVFTLVKKQQEKGKTTKDLKIPDKYKMGEGHVTFFYNKLTYLRNRFFELISELEKRGVNLNREMIVSMRREWDTIWPCWYGTWQPNKEDLALNRERIAVRLSEMELHEKARKKLLKQKVA